MSYQCFQAYVIFPGNNNIFLLLAAGRRISSPGKDPLSSGKCFDKRTQRLRSAGAGIREAGGAAPREIRKVLCSGDRGRWGERGGEWKEGRSRERRLQVEGPGKEAWEGKRYVSEGMWCSGLC